MSPAGTAAGAAAATAAGTAAGPVAAGSLGAAIEIRPVAVQATRRLRQSVLRPHETIEQMAAAEADGAFAVGGFLGERLVAVGLVAPDGTPGGWRIRGMATEPELRGRGAGAAILGALVEHARARGAERIWCNARTPARSLYERAGFRAASEEFELPRIGPHYVMELPGREPAAGRDGARAAGLRQPR